MTKNIISKFIIILIVLFTALSLFWFFKTSAIKKQTLAFIAASGGKISAVSVSVSGFPLEQKLTIEDLKFQLAANLPKTPIALPNSKYQINIKKLEAASSILSGEFKVTNIEDVSFKDQNDVSSLVEFNQVPQAEFSVYGGELVKFSYQDSGYKILDTGKNVLFENGNSSVSFESNVEDNKYHNKVKVEFKDVGMFNNLSHPPVEVVLPDAQNNSIPNDSIPNNYQGDVQTPQEPNSATVMPATSPDSLVKKSFSLEIEYVVTKSSAVPEIPVPDALEVTAINTVSDNSKLESINIKNFEISSPLYKININGEISALQDDGFPISSMSARIEKFDNILIFLKKPISDMIGSETNESEATTINGAIDDDATLSSVSNAPTSESSTMSPANQKPEVDVISIIKDLSKKNPATNDEMAVFDFRQEQGKDLLINETSLSEVMAQIYPLHLNNANSAPEGSANIQAVVPAPNAPTPTTPAVNAPATTTPAVAAPSSVEIAPKLNNAN
jgi:hypothetical protein